MTDATRDILNRHLVECAQLRGETNTRLEHLKSGQRDDLKALDGCMNRRMDALDARMDTLNGTIWRATGVVACRRRAAGRFREVDAADIGNPRFNPPSAAAPPSPPAPP